VHERDAARKEDAAEKGDAAGKRETRCRRDALPRTGGLRGRKRKRLCRIDIAFDLQREELGDYSSSFLIS
jgi:hypothetical protein